MLRLTFKGTQRFLVQSDSLGAFFDYESDVNSLACLATPTPCVPHSPLGFFYCFRALFEKCTHVDRNGWIGGVQIDDVAAVAELGAELHRSVVLESNESQSAARALFRHG